MTGIIIESAAEKLWNFIFRGEMKIEEKNV